MSSKTKYWKKNGLAHAKLLQIVEDGCLDLSASLDNDELKELYNAHDEFKEFSEARFMEKVREMKKMVDETTTMMQVKQVGARQASGRDTKVAMKPASIKSEHDGGGGGGKKEYSPATNALPMYLPSLMFDWSDGGDRRRCSLFTQLLSGTVASMYHAKVVENGSVVVISYAMPREYANPSFILSPNNKSQKRYDERTARWISVKKGIMSAPRKKDDSVSFQMVVKLLFRCEGQYLLPEDRNSAVHDQTVEVLTRKRKRFVESKLGAKTLHLDFVEYHNYSGSEDEGMES